MFHPISSLSFPFALFYHKNDLLHSVLTQSRPNAPADTEVKFILDLDLSMSGQIDPRMAAAGLETLHGHSTPLFQGAITDKLHTALEPA
ncbi:MAG: TIGR04255 family protein [Oscillospiraceae bacterium]|nr:TIGR04255 family protein [Oscillospiraceae bacterium]